MRLELEFELGMPQFLILDEFKFHKGETEIRPASNKKYSMYQNYMIYKTYFVHGLCSNNQTSFTPISNNGYITTYADACYLKGRKFETKLLEPRRNGVGVSHSSKCLIVY